MPNYNQAILVGHLTKDPELKYTQSGQAISKFGIAVNEYVKEGEAPKASFFDVVAFGKTAEFCTEYLSKGDGTMVVGRLHQSTFEDKTGQNRSKVEIIVDKVVLLGKKAPPAREKEPTSTSTNDDAPF